MYCVFHLYEALEQAKLSCSDRNQWLTEVGVELMLNEGTFWNDGHVLYINCSGNTHFYLFVKCYQTVHICCVHICTYSCIS